MAQRVAWTKTAWRDLERIADYIAEDSPGYSAALVRRVRDHARSLEEMAERGRDVNILGLIHGARDLAALWDKEGHAGPEAR